MLAELTAPFSFSNLNQCSNVDRFCTAQNLNTVTIQALILMSCRSRWSEQLFALCF